MERTAVASARLLLAAAVVTVFLGATGRGEASGSPATAAVLQTYGRLPLAFEENRGQSNPQVRFLARGSGYTLFLTPNEVIVRLRAGEARSERGREEDPPAPTKHTPGAVLRMSLVGAHRSPEVSGVDELPGRSHYFVGNDPGAWRSDIARYARVRYREVYPGIDVEYYGNQRQLEHDFVVHPGGDPRSIRLRFDGADDLRLDDAGDLIVNTTIGEVVEKAPVVYQEENGQRRVVEGRYVRRGSREIGFEIGAYDRAARLVVDPGLAYSTYLGGSDSDYGRSVAVDGAGCAYVTGSTYSTDFPTQGAYQTDQGSYDVFVTKLSPNGSSLVYSTYLGGSEYDVGLGIAVDQENSAYVTGETLSTNFPTQSPVQSAQGLEDVFVTKLSASGSSLVYSTYLGGSSSDNGSGIAVDGAGRAYVTGYTSSTDFPTQGPYQTAQGEYDAFVTKLSTSGASLVYSTYLGGSGTENGRGIAVDGDGSAYVTGITASTNFPTQGPFQTDQGGHDVFVTKVAAGGASLVYSTYLGGSGDDRGHAIAVDGAHSAYVTGYTDSTNFPTHGPYQTDQWFDDAFVTKLSPGGGSLVYSTYLGGNGDELGNGIAVDGAGIAYVTGTTDSTDFPTQDPCQTVQSYYDVFVTELSASGAALVYSTYLGGNGYDYGLGIAVDGLMNAYVVGYTDSTDFPTQGPYQTAQGGTDVFVTKLGVDVVFGDGFESGNTSAWSSAVP